LEHLTGRVYGPYHCEVTRAEIARFVAATGDDPERWTDAAPPGFAAGLLFAAAPDLFVDPDVAPHTAALLHSEQRFAWHRPLRAGDVVEVTGKVGSVRSRGAMNLVTFVVTVAASGATALESTSIFVMSATAATGTPPPEEPEPPATERARNDSPLAAALPAAGAALPPLVKSASRADLVRYAAASGDFNPIHWDHAAAVAAGLPGVIVHGLLMAAWSIQAACRFSGESAVPLADLRLRFRRPLRPAVAVAVEGTVGTGEGPDAILDLAVVAAGSDLVTGRATVRGDRRAAATGEAVTD